MSFRTSASVGALLASLAAATTAHADLTAEEVWSVWKSMAEGYGQTLNATETRSGDTLTISDIRFSMEMPDAGTAGGTMGDVAFTENGDGTVSIRLAEEYGITVDVAPPEGQSASMGMALRHQGLDMTASGTPEDLRYDVSAAQMAVAMDRFLVDGKPQDMNFVADMGGIRSTYTVVQGALRHIDGNFDADTMTFDMTFSDATSDGKMTAAGTMTGVSSTSTSAVPERMDSATLGKMLAAGFAASGKLMHKGFTYRVNVTDKGQTTNIDSDFSSGSLDFVLGDGGVLYDVRSADGKIAFSGTAIPFPQLETAFDESAFKFQMPLVETEGPADFALLTKITGLAVSDQIWGMLDPTGQLPHDPATLIVDLAGKAQLTADLTDPATAESGQAPGEVQSLNVKDLQLSIAGADLSGAGAFTFDNSDKVTFGGMPKPTGNLSLKLDGGNTLLDRLVAMGLIPQDQAMGMRMMLGMFARPAAEGGDALESEITVTEDGQVLANGQRLR